MAKVEMWFIHEDKPEDGRVLTIGKDVIIGFDDLNIEKRKGGILIRAFMNGQQVAVIKTRAADVRNYTMMCCGEPARLCIE